MGDKSISQELTLFDKVSVALYRGGIIISMLCLVVGAIILFFDEQSSLLFSDEKSSLTQSAQVIFWIFFCAVGCSIFTLHLYSKQVLRVIQSFYVFAAIILLLLVLISSWKPEKVDYIPAIFDYWLGTIGSGFLLAAFSGIGAKEAFCFKLYEGYAYGILCLLLTLLNLLRIMFDWNALQSVEKTIYLLIVLLVIFFTIRKLRLPLHYDIGDKTKY